ncbi:MAG: hypothetical protein GYA12_03815 [Chloroflexi bacterium]|nr:hypothetical protein [Chloroflexota bacterium]
MGDIIPPALNGLFQGFIHASAMNVLPMYLHRKPDDSADRSMYTVFDERIAQRRRNDPSNRVKTTDANHISRWQSPAGGCSVTETPGNYR